MQRHPFQQMSGSHCLLTSPNIQIPLLPNHNPYSTTWRFFPHTLHYISPINLPRIPHSKRDAAAAKSNALSNTHMLLILHLSALAAWQYTLSATHPTMNQPTVPSHHQRTRTPPTHRFLKRATQYLLNHKLTHCSSYTTPDLPPTLAAPLAVCKAIHSNKYPPVKFS